MVLEKHLTIQVFFLFFLRIYLGNSSSQSDSKRNVFFSRLLTCYMDVWSTLPDPFAGCRLCVLCFTQQVVCFFPTSTYTQFLCMVFGHHCHASLPGQKRCSGTLFCFTMVVFRFALQRVLLGHSCLCFLYSVLHSTSSLLFSRPYSRRNFVRKDSVRMNGVVLIWLAPG